MRRPTETIDTLPNRFVKFALMNWLGEVTRLRGAIDDLPDAAAKRRGQRETDLMFGWLGDLLAQPLFRGVGDLTTFPAGNQVLLKREGYREIFQAYLESEAAAQITWHGGEEVFGIGQRDVATLYEFWTFVQLARVLDSICDRVDPTAFIKITEKSLNVAFAQGKGVHLEGYTTRLGRRLRLRLHYNRTFSRPQSAWSRQMKPDCSLQLSLAGSGGASFEPIWIHFDAKYRADRIVDLLGPADDTDSQNGGSIATAKREDLLKMHAYRDAIRMSRGSYVLYPGLPGGGAEVANFLEYHEILPGLGAFPLRPAEDGDAEGGLQLRRFLLALIDHFASVLSQDRRERYWEARAFAGDPPTKWAGWEPIDGLPAADTGVLVGYVRAGQMQWIRQTGRYNLRADGRSGSVGLNGAELAAPLLLLYGPGVGEPELWLLADEPEIWSLDRMQATGYPGPRGAAYICLKLDRRVEIAALPHRSTLDDLRRSVKRQSVPGEPYVASWLDIAIRTS